MASRLKFLPVIIVVTTLMFALSTLTFVKAAEQKFLTVDAIWGTLGKPMIATPGAEAVPLTVLIFNLNQNVAMRKLKVTLELPDELEWFGEEQECTLNTFLMPYGNFTCTFFLSVKPDAKPGMVKIKVKLEYLLYRVKWANIGGKTVPVFEYETEHEEKHEIELPIVGYTDVRVLSAYFQTNYSLIGPGAENIPLTLLVQNTGTSTLMNVTLTVILRPPLYAKVEGKIRTNLTKVIGLLPPGRPIPVTFLVSISKNTTGGCIYLPVEIKVGVYAKSTIRHNVRLCIPRVNVKVVSAYWGTPGSVMPVGPGFEDVPLTLMLLSTTYIKDVNVCLVPSPIVSSRSKTLCRSIPVLLGGKIIPVTFTVTIPEDVLPGTYTQEVVISYDNVTFRRYVSVTLPSPDIKVVSMVTMPPVVYQGFMNVLLNVTLVNTGSGVAKNVKVSLELPPGFTIETPNYTSVTIPELMPGQIMTIPFMFSVPDSVSPGDHILKVIVRYLNVKREYSFILHVWEKPRFEVIEVDDSRLAPGASNVPLIIRLRYVSGPTLRGVTAYLSLPKVASFHIPEDNPLAGMTANRIDVGELHPGQTIELVYVVDVNSGVPTGSYNATLILTYIPENLVLAGQKVQLATSIPITLRIHATFMTYVQQHVPELISAIIAVFAICAIAIAVVRRRRGR